MNDTMNTEYGLGSRELFGEDRQRILYDQLRSWAQRKNELKNRMRQSMLSSERFVIMLY